MRSSFLAIVSLALAPVIAFSDVYFTPQTNEVVPTPGGLSATLDVNSVHNILSLLVPSTATEMANKTYEVGYVNKGFLGIYKMVLNSITVNSIDGDWQVNPVQFGFVNGTDTLKFQVSNLNVDVAIDGFASGLWLVKGHFKSV